VRDVEPNVSDAVAKIVDRALEFKREDRWETAAEMRAAVRAVIAAKEADAAKLALVHAPTQPEFAPAVVPSSRPPSLSSRPPPSSRRRGSESDGYVEDTRARRRRRGGGWLLPAFLVSVIAGLIAMQRWTSIREGTERTLGAIGFDGSLPAFTLPFDNQDASVAMTSEAGAFDAGGATSPAVEPVPEGGAPTLDAAVVIAFEFDGGTVDDPDAGDDDDDDETDAATLPRGNGAAALRDGGHPLRAPPRRGPHRKNGPRRPGQPRKHHPAQ
jgi:hypothetical protein